MCLACNFLNEIHIYFPFSSRPTDPKFLTGQPEKQINLEWPNREVMYLWLDQHEIFTGVP